VGSLSLQRQNDSSDPVYTINDIQHFYKTCFENGQLILSFILRDKAKYIEAKEEDVLWSHLTVNMARFNNAALRMYATIKHSFNDGKDIEGVNL
tara:strand:- start:887 stop:1168 length:282 start_codon:yes stop_codon:yes gene_type:complete